MNPRRLDKLITILRDRRRQGESGALESLGWRPHHRKVPATFAETDAGETLRGEQIEARTTAVFTIPFLRDVERTDRVEFEGTQYEIVGLLDRAGDRQWLEIQTARVPPAVVDGADASDD